MKRIVMSLILVLLPGLLMAADMGTSAGHDLDALWARAQNNYDLDREDAVILLESHRHSFTAAGDHAHRIHRLVWIGTAVGVREYADLRVPWNSAHADLEVEILRTWRDGRWWPDAAEISDTAVVHTLPHALDRADDYTAMRETMLLHDGVELGCIMETAYTITESGVSGGGGVFVIPQRDPAVLTELRVEAETVVHEERNGAPGTRVLEEGGRHWSVELSPALARPTGSAPELHEPMIAWSTWRDWSGPARSWLQAFTRSIEPDADLETALAEHLNPSQSTRQRARAVGAFLKEMMRDVHYAEQPWNGHPRPAYRTLATAYGHELDRAVLAATLLRSAGLGAEPVLVGEKGALVAPDIPRLDEFTRILLLLEDLPDTFLDPADGLLKGPDTTFGQPVWIPARGARVLPAITRTGQLSVGLELKRDGDGWSGPGSFQGQGFFSGLSALLAEDDLKAGYLTRLVDSVVPGLEVTGASPGSLRPEMTDVTLAVGAYQPPTDGLGRPALVVGRPAGGILDRLPRGVHVHDVARTAPIHGLGGRSQVVTVRLEVAPEDLIQVPEPVSLETLAGTFRLEVTQEDGWLTLTRTLSLGEGPFPAEQWPALRWLLLAEANPLNGTVVWKPAD